MTVSGFDVGKIEGFKPRSQDGMLPPAWIEMFDWRCDDSGFGLGMVRQG